MLEDTLEGKKFLVNETFTAADIAVRSRNSTHSSASGRPALLSAAELVRCCSCFHATPGLDLVPCYWVVLQVVYSAGFWVAMFPDMSTEPASKFPNIRWSQRTACPCLTARGAPD